MTITNYAKKIMKIINYQVPVIFDKSKPNGTKKKLLDVSLAKKYGWKSKISLDEGLKRTYDHFLRNL